MGWLWRLVMGSLMWTEWEWPPEEAPHILMWLSLNHISVRAPSLDERGWYSCVIRKNHTEAVMDIWASVRTILDDMAEAEEPTTHPLWGGSQ